MEEPWTRIVGEKAYRDVVASVADTHNITSHGINKVVRRIPSATNHGEGVPVQVNGVRPTHCATRNGDFDALVSLETIDAARREKVGGILSTAQDLEQHGNSWRMERNTIDCELKGATRTWAKHDGQVDIDVCASRNWIAGHRSGVKWVEIGLHERELACGNVHRRVVCRILMTGPLITKNGYIGGVTEIKSPTRSMRQSTNPIISNWLVGIEDNRVTLANKDLKRINQQRLDVLAIYFDHGELVAVDGEDETRVARDRHEAESVTFAPFDAHDGKGDVLRAARVATFAVDQSGIECRDGRCIRRQVVVPICEGDDSVVIVNIVQVFVRIIWVVNNKSPSQTIAVLVPKMTVIPKCPRLVLSPKPILEGLIRYKRTLSDKCWTVSVIRMLLE